MDSDRTVDMVRLPREEEVFEREAVLGRDTSSVFPSQPKEATGLDAVREMIGGKKFISESELDSIRAQRAGTVEDGIVGADRSLAEILRDNKQKKDDEFKEKWRIMKQGGNRPLDADEAAHFEEVLQQEAKREREWSQLQRQELDAYRQALEEKAAAKDAPSANDVKTNQPPVLKRTPHPAKHVMPRPAILAIKPKAASTAATATGRPAAAGALASRSADAATASTQHEPPSKRQRQDGDEAVDTRASAAVASASGRGSDDDDNGGAHQGNALSSLLGGYGDDDDDSDGAD